MAGGQPSGRINANNLGETDEHNKIARTYQETDRQGIVRLRAFLSSCRVPLRSAARERRRWPEAPDHRYAPACLYVRGVRDVERPATPDYRQTTRGKNER